MAKKARKAKTVGKKSASRKKALAKKPRTAKAKKKVVKKALVGRAFVPRPGALPRLARPDKRKAVFSCFKHAMDLAYPHWNDDGRGLGKKFDDDLKLDVNSMQALLDVVRSCLLPTFHLDTNDDDYVRSCVTSTVSEAIGLTIDKTS